MDADRETQLALIVTELLTTKWSGRYVDMETVRIEAEILHRDGHRVET